MTKKQLIEKFGKENNLWYIDVEGVDQNGLEVWLSGNVLRQSEFGFGGFYDYETCNTMIKNWEKFGFEATSDPEILRNCSEDDVTLFIPRVLHLGFAPIDEDMEDEYQIWLERVL